MNGNLLNSLNNYKVPKTGYYGIKQRKCEDKTQESSSKIGLNRPAQAISFSGSAVSVGQKIAGSFVESQKINKLIGFVNENEVAFNAIYSLIIAGMLKPGLVLAQTGFDDKDGQLIATKNFLQAFIGSFLSLTIGGGFIKKIYDTMSSNLKLMKLDLKDNITMRDADDPKVLEVAKNLLKKEHSSFGDKFANAKETAAKAQGMGNKIKGFLKGLQKTNYKPAKEEISTKASELLTNLKNNHFEIFTRSESSIKFTKKLLKNMEALELSPSTLRKAAKEGLRSQPLDSFESFWKNSTGIITAVMKAKLSSVFLPVVVGALFAKRNLEQKAKEDHARQENASSVTITRTIEKQRANFAPVIDSAPSMNSKLQPSFNGIMKTLRAEPNFTGSLEGAIDVSARGLERLATTGFSEKCTDVLSKLSKKPSARMADLESFGLTAYWVYNTQRSKKIEPDQKAGLNAHTILVTVVSSLSAFVLDWISDGLIDGAENAYRNKINTAADNTIKALSGNKEATKEQITSLVSENTKKLFNSKEIVEKLADSNVLNSKENISKAIEDLAYKYSKQLGKFKSLLIFTMVVRFLVPVLTVKQSKKLKKFLVEFSEKRNKQKEEKSQEAQKIAA